MQIHKLHHLFKKQKQNKNTSIHLLQLITKTNYNLMEHIIKFHKLLQIHLLLFV